MQPRGWHLYLKGWGLCRCWHDNEHDCINLITEFFTSGNLREYRQKHRHLELKAVRKWARQILSGLDYLHLKDPPVIHGDLRCDKVCHVLRTACSFLAWCLKCDIIFFSFFLYIEHFVVRQDALAWAL